MRKNYKGFAWRLDNIKEVCNSLAKDILGDHETFRALHEDKGIMDIVVCFLRQCSGKTIWICQHG